MTSSRYGALTSPSFHGLRDDLPVTTDAGYSGTPLVRKLGIKPGHRVAFVNAPEGEESDLTTLEDVEGSGPD